MKIVVITVLLFVASVVVAIASFLQLSSHMVSYHVGVSFSISLFLFSASVFFGCVCICIFKGHLKIDSS